MYITLEIIKNDEIEPCYNLFRSIGLYLDTM